MNPTTYFFASKEVIIVTITIGWIILVNIIVRFILFSRFILLLTRLGLLLAAGLVVNNLVL